jgi:hypothetical protein
MENANSSFRCDERNSLATVRGHFPPVPLARSDCVKMTDRRRYPRIPARIPAKIIFDCFTAVGCVVRDLSEGGARLDVQGAGTLPPVFDLLADGAEGFRTCEVAWRSGDHLGVSFR